MAPRPESADKQGDALLARSQGIDDDGMATVARIFRDVTAAFGINGAPVFDRLASGQSLAQALSVSPAVADVMYARAHSWFSLGRVDRAQTLFRALCLLDERNADYWIGYGVCLRMAQQSDSAWKAFEIAAILRPDWAVPHFHALELSLSLRQWDRARDCLAAYDKTVTPEIPMSIVQEAQRLRGMLDVRQAVATASSAVAAGV